MNHEDEVYGLISVAKQQQKIIEDQQKTLKQWLEDAPNIINQTVETLVAGQETYQKQLIDNTQQSFHELSRTIRVKLWFSMALPFLALCLLVALGTGFYINHLMISTPELREANRLLKVENEKLIALNTAYTANYKKLKLFNTETYRCEYQGKTHLCARIMISWGPQAGQRDLYILDPKDE